MKERNFSKNIFSNAQTNSSFLYQDKPDYTKIEQFMNEYENQYLETISNTEWFLYPFLKTLRTLCRKMGCCRDLDKPKKKSHDNKKID
jgi:hypothetical protein